jgi:hypothetical protein
VEQRASDADASSLSVIQNPVFRGNAVYSRHLRKSRDTLQKVIKEQRLSWKN